MLTLPLSAGDRLNTKLLLFLSKAKTKHCMARELIVQQSVATLPDSPSSYCTRGKRRHCHKVTYGRPQQESQRRRDPARGAQTPAEKMLQTNIVVMCDALIVCRQHEILAQTGALAVTLQPLEQPLIAVHPRAYGRTGPVAERQFGV